MRRRTILAGITNLAWPWQWFLSVFFGSTIEAIPAPPNTADESTPGVGGVRLGSAEQPPPKFQDYATIEAVVNGEPVYGLDYMMYIYGVSPDLMPASLMQQGNENPRVKIKPKKSWEIKHNLLGSTTEQIPRTRRNDSHPLLPIHLIDGDPDTVWASYGSIRPDVYPEWIRIDLPIEAAVASVALVCSKNFYPESNFGRALPKELTVKLSKDAWRWEEVYSSQDVDTEASESVEIKFAPRRAKQIWITGNYFTKRSSTPSGGRDSASFSIGEVEVRDPAGNNLALVSRGAGVTTSSTCYGHNCDRLTQEALWAPLQYDMGMKWVNIVGGATGAYDWAYIEKERGKYEIDPVMDRWLRDLERSGINLIWGLNLYGNPIYLNPPRITHWTEDRWHTFSDGILGESQALTLDETPEIFEAWLRYVDFVARYFKGRVHTYEVCDEWSAVLGGGGGWDDSKVERYMKIFEKAYETVKHADPDARIMPGHPEMFAPDLLLTLLGQERKAGIGGGKLMASGGDVNDLARSTFVVDRRLNDRDVEVQVDALNRGTFGIVFRYTSPQSFVLASTGPYSISISERTGDTWTAAQTSTRNIGWPFSSNLHLKLRVEGPQATLTVSDGNRDETVSHPIKAPQLHGNGSFGLVQLIGANQEFTNFRVDDVQRNVLSSESFQGENGSLPAGWKYVFGPYVRNPVKPGWAPKIDGIGWHPVNVPDAAYFKAVRRLQEECEALGFKGRYHASALFNFYSYPAFAPGPGYIQLSELQAGVASAVGVVGHSGLDTVAATQIIHFTGYASTDSNCRWAWPGQVITPVQPSVLYYMWRTLATVLDDFHPAKFPVAFTSSKELLWFAFARGKTERMVAVWIASPGATLPNEIAETPSDMRLLGIRAQQAWVIDLMNGTEQELRLARTREDTVIRDMRIKSYPTMIRFISK